MNDSGIHTCEDWSGGKASSPLVTDTMPERERGSETQEPFATYICHKKVRAAKITRIVDEGQVEVADGKLIYFSPCGKPTPKVGWYVVFYEDGYLSFSPSEKFEEGYTRENL